MASKHQISYYGDRFIQCKCGFSYEDVNDNRKLDAYNRHLEEQSNGQGHEGSAR